MRETKRFYATLLEGASSHFSQRYVEFESPADAYVQIILQALSPKKRVIAVGGSVPLFANLLFLNPGMRVVYIDYDKNALCANHAALQKYPRIVPNITFISREPEETIGTSFAAEPGDILLMLQTLHHFSNPERILATYKDLVPDGWLVIADTIKLGDSEPSVREILATARLEEGQVFYNPFLHILTPSSQGGVTDYIEDTSSWFSIHSLPKE